jgi:selenocysteine lyase/cysteine desulfurase
MDDEPAQGARFTEDAMAHALGRRTFLSRVAASSLIPGLVPTLDLAADLRLREAEPFEPLLEDEDARAFAAARRRFLFPTNVTYGNTGTLGAMPRDVLEALTDGLERLEHDLPEWPYFQADGEPLTGYQPLTEFRSEAGTFLNAPPDEIAFTQNATMGMSFLANGLDLAAGDEVVTTDEEHSGGIGGWLLRSKRHGIVVKQLPIRSAVDRGPDGVLQLFADAISARTRVVMFSHITASLGIRLPAKELCHLAHDRGAIAVLDGAQAVGQIQVDVKDLDCDAYVTSPHKWLLAPKGTGLLYIRRDLQPRVWNTLASGGFDDQTTGAFRFMHYGTGSLPVVHGLRAALGFIGKIGIARIERWDAMLTKRLRDGLAGIPAAHLSSPADPRFSAAITTFAVAGHTARELQDGLWERKIRVRAQGEPRGVRLCAHLYVSPADIDRVLDVVSSLA